MQEKEVALSESARIVHAAPFIGRRDDTVGNPHSAQVSPLELFELKFINPSFSSSSCC